MRTFGISPLLWACEARKLYLILSPSLGSTSAIDLSQASDSLIGENSSDYAGISVSAAGDIDGDGLFEILIGAPSNNDTSTGSGKMGLFTACPIQ